MLQWLALAIYVATACLVIALTQDCGLDDAPRLFVASTWPIIIIVYFSCILCEIIIKMCKQLSKMVQKCTKKG